jgi:hypothetical protein
MGPAQVGQREASCTASGTTHARTSIDSIDLIDPIFAAAGVCDLT